MRDVPGCGPILIGLAAYEGVALATRSVPTLTELMPTRAGFLMWGVLGYLAYHLLANSRR